nr:Rz1 family lipoprotein [Escherichia coli]
MKPPPPPAWIMQPPPDWQTPLNGIISPSEVIKPSNPFTNVCWVSVLTTFSAPPQIFAASTVFFCPIPETKK